MASLFMRARAAKGGVEPGLSIRRSSERGGANHGWLRTKHTFSFAWPRQMSPTAPVHVPGRDPPARYSDPRFDGFGPFRVLNEDHVTPSDGFGTHPHRDYEIFSYVLGGEIRHRDSMGNTEVVPRGGVQFTSAGTGIMHSEYNASNQTMLHFLQMWVKPRANGLKPGYDTRAWTDEDKTDRLLLILSRDGRDGSITINQEVDVYASILTPGADVAHGLDGGKGRKAYLHLTELGGQLRVESTGGREGTVTLDPGDGVFISDVSGVRIASTGNDAAEFVLVDILQD